ncbi:hypothetical protein EJB05_10535, partial [Eragrostis curvula]
MPLCCVECKPCTGGGLRALFKCRRPTFQLRRAFGKMRGGHRRRRRAGSFSSVRAVFWPLMSMRSDADARTDDRPPSSSTDDDSGARAPSPSLDDTPGAGAASTTAARVLALQARLGEADDDVPPPPKQKMVVATASPARAPSPPQPPPKQKVVVATASPARAPSAARVLALQARLANDAPAPPLTTSTTNTTVAAKARSIRVQAVREHAKVVDDEREVNDVEAACRSFERHLMEMLVDERKVMDLMDVEELLVCWDKLRSPVFVQLVGRFYGELCMDLFSSDGSDADVSSEQEALTV